MLSSNQIKYIRSLQQKKFRIEFKKFVAEGDTLICDLIQSAYKAEMIIATNEWLENKSAVLLKNKSNIFSVKESELERISSLKTPNQVIAVFEIPDITIDIEYIKSQLTLVLDDIKDPGNLGTIIRIADWFGIHNIICSPETVDVYNSKVIQATMGSIARVNVFYMPIMEFLKSLPSSLNIYGTFLDGESVYSKNLSENGIIIIGNESNGISNDLLPFISEKLLIPSYSSDKKNSKAESLNASVATAVICSEFRRNSLKNSSNYNC